ncbi:MAG: TlpA family protein disulfide reductase [Cytophagaceae bacterium]|nr:TlpA family protein disulfide reductase [Cytophagaceae bacterium]
MKPLNILLTFFLLSAHAFAQDIYQGLKPESLFTAPVEQAFLKEFGEKFGPDFDASAQYVKAQSSTVDTWEMGLFDARKAQSQFYKNHPQAGQFSEPFKKHIEACVRWNYWHLLLAYPIVRGNAQQNQGVVISLPSVMLENFDETKVSEEAALSAEPYRNFLTYYLTYFNSKEKSFAKYADWSRALEDKAAYARQHLSGKSYQYALARLLNEHCDKAAPSTVRSLFGVLGTTSGSAEYAAVVKAKCADVMARKDEPVVAKKEAKAKEPGPNVFFFSDQQGQPVTLDAFRGKVVYLDVWASWCGPCRAEFPFSKQLHERLTDKQKKQVVFLYLSIDDTEAAWKAALEKLQLPGEQGWSKGGWGSKVVQYFGIQSIPRYVLIDKTGKVADVNAKRPSNAGEVWQDILRLVDAP